MGRVNAGHYIVGVEGLALMRTWLTGERAQADRRIEDLTRFVADPHGPPLAIELEVPEADVVPGYSSWAPTYDVSPNALIYAEQPVVRALIAALPPGRALDAACGTGRHTKYLVERGHHVIGVDATPVMLAKARAELPAVDFRVGDLLALPLETASVDLAVCALALTHLEQLGPPLAELTRVLRPGGRLIVSDLHPLHSALGMTAFFVAEDGSAAYVRSYAHTHSAYLAAFRSAGLVVEQCSEPLTDDDGVVMMSGGMMNLASEAFRTALLGLPAALIWDLRKE
jgi:ubiquinone/menaquinone biosynthesis C-methylase UbiE